MAGGSGPQARRKHRGDVCAGPRGACANRVGEWSSSSNVVYIVVKYLAYTVWCYAGLRLLTPQRPRPMRTAALLGGARLALGIVLGLFIFFAALSMNNATRNAPLTYFSIYVPRTRRRVDDLPFSHWCLSGISIRRLGVGWNCRVVPRRHTDRNHGGRSGAGGKAVLLIDSRRKKDTESYRGASVSPATTSSGRPPSARVMSRAASARIGRYIRRTSRVDTRAAWLDTLMAANA